jgi:hypothetical protein
MPDRSNIFIHPANVVLSRTQIRRLQRRHSQTCYRLLQQKLVSVLRPLPQSAIACSELEEFRKKLYSGMGASGATSIGGRKCTWCGIWEPIVEHLHHCEIGKQSSQRRLEMVSLSHLAIGSPEVEAAAKAEAEAEKAKAEKETAEAEAAAKAEAEAAKAEADKEKAEAEDAVNPFEAEAWGDASPQAVVIKHLGVEKEQHVAPQPQLLPRLGFMTLAEAGRLMAVSWVVLSAVQPSIASLVLENGGSIAPSTVIREHKAVAAMQANAGPGECKVS